MRRIILLLGMLVAGLASALAQSQNIVEEIAQAPEFILNDLNGEEVALTDYQGSYVVLHIATTWCPFCNAEAPHLQKLFEMYAENNVKVLIIDVKEPAALVKEKLQDRFNFTFPLLLDTDGQVAASFAPSDLLPDLARDEIMLASNIVIDPAGKIIYMSLLDSKNFDARLTEVKQVLDERLAIH